MTTWQIRERGLGGDKTELESYIDTLVEQFVKYYSYPKGSEQYIGIAAHVCKFLVEQGVDISPLGKKGAGLMMAKWQIRQRGSNKVLQTWVSDSCAVESYGVVRAVFDGKRDYMVDDNFDYGAQYICKAGEVLVSEEEHKLLQNERDVFLGSLESVSKENDELKARIAELEQQLEAKKEPKPSGCDHSSFEGSCIRAEHKLIERAKAKAAEVTLGDEVAALICRLAGIEYEQSRLLEAGIQASPEVKGLCDRRLIAKSQLAALINNVKG